MNESQVKMGPLDASELVLSGENPWRDCKCCKGHGDIPKQSKPIKDSMGNDSSLAIIYYEKCPKCQGQGRVIKEKFRGVHKMLNLPHPTHPGVKERSPRPALKYTLVTTG